MDEQYVMEHNMMSYQDIEVDYDYNPTVLYLNICDSDWYSALLSVRESPIEARIWVVKRENKYRNDEYTCRFLPIHSACARKPPIALISALLKAYPDAAAQQDDNGMYPLHYACSNRASAEVIRMLMKYCPDANFQRVEVSGALPIHLAAQWGVSSISVMDVLLKNNISLASARDSDGLTALEVAIDADYYEGKREVLNLLKDAVLEEEIETSSTISSDDSRMAEEDFRQVEIVRQSSKANDRISFHKVEKLKEQAIKLNKGKEYIATNVKEQIKLEWKAVNAAIKEMDQKVEKFKKTKTTFNEYDPFDEEKSESGVSENLENIKDDNIQMEKELAKLQKIFDAYLFKAETIESIIEELVKTMTRVSSGHRATVAKLKQMESNMKEVSEKRADKLKHLTSELDEIAANLSSLDISSEEKKSNDLMKKEVMILDKMNAMLSSLKG
mmetsp:Transcript_12709/g.14345  ORF Transcript_12709/g.14345 Transcript_12709/m.14345 type:complete len:444 (+) Transcript_12709:94-1425(+)